MEKFEIYTLDLGFLGQKELIASYLIKGERANIIIETGPESCWEQMERELKRFDLEPRDITHVFLSHIHLDHAGAAWRFAREGATIFAHYKAAKHLIDPSRLWASASRVYGAENMAKLWGEMQSIPAEQVVELRDGGSWDGLGESLFYYETPGHASHHIVYKLGDALFTGDIGGIRHPRSRHIRVPTPPPEFSLELWLESIKKMRSLGARRVYLTHFGGYDGAPNFLDKLEKNLKDSVEFIRQEREKGEKKEEIVESYANWLAEKARLEGTSEELLEHYEMMIGSESSVTGMLRYFDKMEAKV